MIKNYLKIAWRNLLRNKAFSAINIAGLALGMTCSILILLWVRDERGIDGFHQNDKQLFQVYERNFYDGKVTADYPTQGLLAEELKRVMPEIQFASGFESVSAPGSMSNFEANSKVNKMSGFFGGEDFFKMFSYPLLQGTANTALNTPGTIAISRHMAENFFGTPEKAIGQTIRYENKEELKVSAVFENIPSNSSQQFDFLRTWSDFVRDNQWVNNWGNTDPASYIQLRKNANANLVQSRIKEFIYRYKQKETSFRTELALQPYSAKYLHSNFNNGELRGGRIEYVRLFTLIAVFILIIACINFMNLATARSAKRAKEVGLRKVIGAMRQSLIFQFIGEAMLLTFVSAILAIVLTLLILPAFNTLTGKQLFLPFSLPGFWLILFAILLATGFVAGSYPAFFLSSLKPVKVLKGALKFSRGATFFRQGLVIFQFILSIILIVGMIVIYRQMKYIQTTNLGYDRENLVYLPIEGELVNKYELFKEQAAHSPGILSISKMRNSPTVIQHHNSSISWPAKDPNLMVSFADGVVGYDFVKTMKLQMKEGRDFSKGFGTDSASYILNETAAAKMGYRNAVGETVSWGNHPGKIIGVIKDFHFSSLHEPIEPLILRLQESWPWGNILVRTKAGATKEAISSLGKLAKEINPKFPFTYQFSDLEFSNLYKSEEMVSRLSNYFAFLAIFISCLGLFGLATFTAAQRTKEIGVRKIVGASVSDIIIMLSGSFVKLVLIAIIVAFPVAWTLMNRWLDNYSYKIAIQWWFFGLAALITLSIALLTISYQSIKAALSNPVNSLRSE